jgi:hypothetical protein
MKTGKLIRDKVYLTWKQPNNIPGEPDVNYIAPAGSVVIWLGQTNEGSERYYGDRLLYWIDLPEFGFGIGAELGIDFEWDGGDDN